MFTVAATNRGTGVSLDETQQRLPGKLAAPQAG
jgi:hypothetical protein